MPDASYALGFVARRGTAFEQHQDQDTIQFRHAGPDAMEAHLAEPGFSEAFVDFTPSPRPSWADDSLTVAHNTTRSKRIVPSGAFDGVYFINRVTFENVLQMN